MKHFLLSLIMFIAYNVSTFAQANISADPISLGLLLIEQPSVDKMVNICRYYNLVEEPYDGEYQVFHHPKGTIYQFKVDGTNPQYTPTVKIITKDSQKTIDNILISLGYKKEGSRYVKGTKFELRRTVCTISVNTKKVLTFEKEYNPIE